MQDSGTAKVKLTIEEIYARKKIAAYALCLHYSALALQYFRKRQSGRGLYWTNRTHLAADTVFSGAFKEEGEIVGWFMAHTLQYGVYLEKANNEKHAALNPIVNHFQPYFMYHMREIYAD